MLAAGRSTRFRSATPKILHPLAGQPLLQYGLAAARALRPAQLVVVLNPDSRSVVAAALPEALRGVKIAVQRDPLGTAHAVQAAATALRGFAGHVLILCGDVPLLRAETLQTFVDAVAASAAPGGLLTMTPADPFGYGRVVRTTGGSVHAIVEERDADAGTRAIREVNTGIYCCDARWLFTQLKRIGRGNAQREFYLTDLAALAAAAGTPLVAVSASDATEFAGVNSRAELAALAASLRRRLNDDWMRRGVSFLDPATAYVDATVTIGEESVIGPSVTLAGTTRIGRNCVIGHGAVLTNAQLADGVAILPYSVIDDAVVGPDCRIGPFARLRPGTRLDAHVHVGNFVETKKAWLKCGAKANHLTYLGDATIGAKTNIGCGTITCNYDGVAKHQTTIGEGVFVGSDTAFVAPVRIGNGATIGAGSVITDDVPPHSLALARGRQVVKRGWKRK
ncbi:MAG: bifunctional UDP-N-acetylglucosamine diphosphorylase/glucosamine-1-phosphate N-acetyltransferase GlmU [Deltaproteobacteria bacterium]|nr:bifunctional UDP-N-acetylglucosamine diphosphorylase/glucosamine-1-phosphate N-acetyltransferase GlmU [Deltaproteobacteria bacterium]